MKPIDKCRRVSIEEALTPREGERVIAGRWWVVTPEGEILIYGVDSFQCNNSEAIIERIIKKMYPECTARYIDTVFLPISY